MPVPFPGGTGWNGRRPASPCAATGGQVVGVIPRATPAKVFHEFPARLYDSPTQDPMTAQFHREFPIADRRVLLLSFAVLPLISGCAVATATVAVGSAAVSVASTAVGLAADVAVGTVKGAAKVTGAVIDAASGTGSDGASEPKADGEPPSKDPLRPSTP
jgi:hypothetical protein